MESVIQSIAQHIHVFANKYEDQQFDTFRADVRPLRTTNTLRAVLGLKLHSIKAHIAVMGVALLTAILYLTMACLGEDNLQVSY